MIVRHFREKFSPNGKASFGFRAGCVKLRSWCFEWNRTIATALAFLTFLLILLSMVLDRLEEQNEPCSECQLMCAISPKTRNTGAKCVKQRNGFFCSDIYEKYDNLTAEINNAIEDTRLTQINNLIIQNCIFNETTLKNGWLRFVHPSVKQLELKNTNINELGERAFEGHPFDWSLETLTVVNCKIRMLRKHTFQESAITRFEFRHSAPGPPLLAEAGALDGLKEYLQILQLTNCLKYEETVQNLTGINGSILNKLVNVDFRDNMLTSLGNDSFSKARNIKMLNLKMNSLERLEVNAFRPQGSYEVLQIDGNSLETLPEGIFHGITKAQLHLYNNNWQCDCRLVWLKKMYEKGFVINKSEPLLCKNFDWKRFDEVNFCDEDDTTIPTTTTTTQTTPSPPGSLIKVPCRNLKIRPMILPSQSSLYYLKTIRIGRRDLQFTIHETDWQFVYLKIDIEGDTRAASLFWYNSNTDQGCRCVKNFQKTIVMDNLQRHATYTLCLIYDNSTKVWPSDCSSITIPPVYGERSWMSQKHVPVFFVITVTSFLLTVLTSGFLMFYCIRQHPNLLKGNKRIIIVESETADAMVLPKPYQKSSVRKELPVLLIQNRKRLPPTNRAFPGMEDRPAILRSVSDCSAANRKRIACDDFGFRRSFVARRREPEDCEHIYEEPAAIIRTDKREKWDKREIGQEHFYNVV